MSRVSRSFVIVVVLAAMFLSLACSFSSILPGGQQPTAAPSVPEGTPVQVPTGIQASPTALSTAAAQPTKSSAATKPANPTAATNPTQPAGTSAPNLSNLQTSLDKLDSYRLSLVMTVKGKDANGKDATQEFKLLQEVIKSKESLHLMVQGVGISLNPGSDETGIEIYQIGKTSYMVTAEAGKDPTCISFSSDSSSFDPSALVTPEDMVDSVQGQSLIAKGETVNGLKADHYKLQSADLGFGTLKSQSGEIWVAQDGGYLVRYVGNGEGDFSIGTDKITGTGNWTYDLTEVNKLKEIALPTTCKDSDAAVKDLPIPTNATEQGSFGGIITYKSPDAPKAVGDFYRKEAPASGWKISSDSNMGTVVMITIKKDTRTYSIMITVGDNDKGSSVVITPQ